MDDALKERKYAIAAMAVFSFIMFTIAIVANGTGDGGDSIFHYLFARYAYAHPENLLNHWAKPFFTLVMSPFAQFGFIGAKLFNTFLSCTSVWFSYLIARELKLKWAIAVFGLALFFRIFLSMTFSGLTEPLNNALLSIAIYLAITKRYAAATILMSFSPFIRSEGLFLCGTFSLYLMWMRQWKVIPLLLLGHIIYSIVGYPYYKDFLWVFHQIPYGFHSSHYGKGTWTHYIVEMPFIVGVVNCFLLTVGILYILISSIYFVVKRNKEMVSITSIFLMLIFLVFLGMHSAFWGMGIFASYGLVRVFLAVACVMLVLMIVGLEFIDSLISRISKKHAIILSTTLLILSPFFAFHKSYYAFSKYDFSIFVDQVIDVRMADYIKQQYPDYKNRHLYADATYMNVLLNVDRFDSAVYSNTNYLQPNGKYLPKGLILWDGWYSEFEQGTHIDSLRKNKQLREIKDFDIPGEWGETFRINLFEVAEDSAKQGS